MSDVILRLANIESSYGPVQAIRGVSLEVRKGSIATVLGANGAGKTTILKTISGIIDPRKGTVTFEGEEIQRRDADWVVRRGISHVPEGREVFALLTVRENLLMGAYTRQDRDGVARDIERMYGYFPVLKERAAQEAGQLSGGQQQMLAIARSLMARPKLLLLDEPAASLDAHSEQRVMQALTHASTQQTTLLVTHQLEGLADWDAVWVMQDGQIIEQGDYATLARAGGVFSALLAHRQEEI